MLSSRSFIGSSFTFKSLVCLELILVSDESQGPSFPLLNEDIHFHSTAYPEVRSFFTLCSLHICWKLVNCMKLAAYF